MEDAMTKTARLFLLSIYTILTFLWRFLAARRADEVLDRGDSDSQLVWLRIRRAIAELQAAPSGLAH
jgi:hypothetical protein